MDMAGPKEREHRATMVVALARLKVVVAQIFGPQEVHSHRADSKLTNVPFQMFFLDLY